MWRLSFFCIIYMENNGSIILMYQGEFYVKNRKFLVTYGYNLDHSNIDHLVSDRLSRHKGWIQKDYFDPVLHQGAAFILNYQIIDTNVARVSQRYYLDDFHVTEAQLQGFLYSLNKLKGTHVLCNPTKQGHHWTVIDDIEYSCYAYQTLDGRDLRFLEYDNDVRADANMKKGIPRIPEHQHYLTLPSDCSQEEKDRRLTDWFKGIIEAGKQQP